MAVAITAYARRVGVPPGIVKVYENLGTVVGPRSPAGGRLRAIAAAGATPLLSLEPTWPGARTRDVMLQIATGGADSLIAARAHDIESLHLPHPVVVELAAEMNARFGAPWQAPDTADGGERAGFAARYVVAWRRVVEIFRTRSAAPVRWLWSVSAGNPYTHAASGGLHWNWYDRYYPGDDVVDAVGLHAFNDPIGQHAWIPFVELVDGEAADHALSSLSERHLHKPIFLSELATDEQPGNARGKAAWIRNAFASVRRCAPVTAVVWFDAHKERDWRFASSPASAAAYRDAARPMAASRSPGAASDTL